MDTDEVLYKQLDVYSNAVVAFSVVQGIGYLYYFGSNSVFNCQVKTATYLAGGLIFAFLLVGILSVVSLYRIYAFQRSLIEDHAVVLKSILVGKIVASTIFYLFPALVTLFYGVLVKAPDLCEQFVG